MGVSWGREAKLMLGGRGAVSFAVSLAVWVSGKVGVGKRERTRGTELRDSPNVSHCAGQQSWICGGTGSRGLVRVSGWV